MTFDTSAAQTTAPTGSMIGATFTARPSMITMSAFLPGVSDPVRSASPATCAPPIVAHPSTWREVMRSGDGVFPSRSACQASRCFRPRSEPRIERIWVNWSAGAVVATSDDRPIGRPYWLAVQPGAQPWPIWISICGANETLPPESRASAHSSSVKCEAWTYVVFG